jgi:hypothetical protein
VEERRFSAASRYVLMWKSGPSGPRQRREKEEPSPPGTAETPRELKKNPSAASLPALKRAQGRGTRHDGRFFFAAANAALDGPLSCGIICGMARGQRTAGIDWWKSAASRYVLMWKSGPSGPRHRREKQEPNAVRDGRNAV